MRLNVYNFFNRFVQQSTNKSKGIYNYGENDLLPNDNLKLIGDCGVAKRAVSKKAMYVQGDGLADAEKSKIKVNEFQTADQLLSETSFSVAPFDGFAWQIKRNGNAEIVDIKAIPFECVRKKTDGTFSYNPLRGTKDFKDQDSTIHPAFRHYKTPADFLAAFKSFDGKPEILYVFRKTADHPHYPIPDYYAGLEDIKTCIEISKMDYELSVNGFMPSAILVTQEIDNSNKDENEKTALSKFQEGLKKFSGQEKTDEGGRFKLMHIMVSAMAEAPQLTPYDAKSILEASNTKRDVIAREVCRLFGVHPVLAGFSDAQILGNVQALSNAITELNNTINPLQRMISEAFAYVFQQEAEDWTITQFNPITYIPDQVWETLTEDEKRSIAGYDPKPKETPEPTPQPSLNGTPN